MKKLPDCENPKDVEVWAEEIKQVVPIKQPEEKPSEPLVIGEIEKKLRMEGVYNSNSFKPLTVGNTDNIDGNTADKFRKGLLKIEARLDLHGRTEKEAFTAVADFIRTGYTQGRRCVLIITGKGLKQKDEPWYETKGVIREALPSWLNHPDIRPFVLGMSQAKPADGGSGAMYVLLKRQRCLPQTD